VLAVLEGNFRPDTFSHTFATLFSLTINKQDEECIHEFWACVEGHLHNFSRLMVSIPPILQAMLFLWALHSCYKAIIDLFALKQKDILVALILSFLMQNTWTSLLSLALMANLVLSRMIH
jgi:hypothetical protein